MRLRHELRAEGLADHFEDASLHLQFVSDRHSNLGPTDPQMG